MMRSASFFAPQPVGQGSPKRGAKNEQTKRGHAAKRVPRCYTEVQEELEFLFLLLSPHPLKPLNSVHDL